MIRQALTILVLFMVALAPTTVVQAQTGIPAWTNRYVGPGGTGDIPLAIGLDTNGNVFVAGMSRTSIGDPDFATIKYASTGAPLWTNRYNGPGNAYDAATALAVDPSGNLIVTGQTYTDTTNISYATIKYSNAGIPQWTRLYAAGTSGGATAIALDAGGNVFVTGTSNADLVTIKYSSSGGQQWVRRYPSGVGGNAYLAVDDNGDVVVAGTANLSDRSYVTLKYSNAAGTPLWTNLYNGAVGSYKYDTVKAIITDGSANVYVTGESQAGDSHYEYATIKYTNGVAAWVRRFSRFFTATRPNDLTVDGSGNVFVTGTEGNQCYATIAYSSLGMRLWTNFYYGGVSASAVAVDGSGNVFVTGAGLGSGPTNDCVTIAYSGTTGAGLWTNAYNGPADSEDYGSAISVDRSGNVFVTGGSIGTNGYKNYATIKYLGVAPTQINLGFAKSANGILSIAFTNAPGAQFSVLATTNLTLPLSNWTELGVATESSPGQFQFTNLPAMNGSQWFYRVRSP